MSSVVAFARLFLQLKTELSRDGEADLRLMRLADFAQKHAASLQNPTHASYLEEWRALVEHQLEGQACLDDLAPDELRRVAKACEGIVSESSVAKLHRELARKLCYVGEAAMALAWLDSGNEDERQSASKAEADDATDETTAARRILETLPPDSSTARETEKIIREWRLEREALSFDSVKCLFVDKNGPIATGRGRMRTLVCRNADAIKGQETNELVFDNQVRGPDDPFVGASYNALHATELLLQRDEKGSNSRCLRVHLAIEDSSQAFTGDSIALAVALVSFAKLMKPQIHRHERFVAGEIAVTGSLSADGTLLPVNGDSLNEKITRAFFSPVKYVVLPHGNAAAARDCIEKLRQQYPRRRLQVIAHERLQDVIDDHNVIRPEKVCMGEFVARKAGRYTRSVKVQVPLLISVTWLLLALLWPKHFDPWFDGNPVRLEIEGNVFRTFNENGEFLWSSTPFEANLTSNLYEAKGPWEFVQLAIRDIDRDGLNEIVFVPIIDSHRGRFSIYDHDGSLMGDIASWFPTTYPGDIAYDSVPIALDYSLPVFLVLENRLGQSYILTKSDASPPIRSQFNLFNHKGEHSGGPYIHTGGIDMAFVDDSESDSCGFPRILLGGTNNRYNRAGFFCLNPSRLWGVSPPYDDELFLLSGMPEGSQEFYVALPETHLSDGIGVRNWVVTTGFPNGEAHYAVRVTEGSGCTIDGIFRDQTSWCTSELPLLEYRLDSALNPLKAHFWEGNALFFNGLLKKRGFPPIQNADDYLDSLTSCVDVYRSATFTP